MKTKALKPIKKQQGKKYSNEEKTKIINAIGSLYSTNQWTLESCCKNQGISERTFNNWVKASSDLADIFKEYKNMLVDVKKTKLKKLAHRGLELLIQERTVTSKRTVVKIGEDGTARPSEVITTEINIQPSVAAIIFVLTNLDPENWKNTKHYEAKLFSAHLGSKKDIENMTDEELENEKIKLLNLLNIS